MINPMTVLNFFTSGVLFFYAAYMLFVCRKEVKGMMLVFFMAGLWAFGVHLLVMIDQTVIDFICWQTVTNYLIRPLLFVLMCTVLGAIIRLGWRYDR